MAIGSAPEIGVTFHNFKHLTPEQQAEWFRQVREFGPDGVTGYATLAYPPGREPPWLTQERTHKCEQPPL
jgi:hypothetical protein